MIAQSRLKLLVFWAKHMWRTCRGVDELTDVDYDEDIKPLQDQKGLEDSLDESKEPEPPTMTLTPTSVASCFIRNPEMFNRNHSVITILFTELISVV